MQYKLLALAAATLSAAQQSQSESQSSHSSTSGSTTTTTVMTSTEIVGNINHITTLSKNTNTLASNLGGLNIFTSVPEIVVNFGEIVASATADIAMLGAGALTGSSFSDNGQNAICSAFADFVMVHQDLLMTIIGQHGLLSSTPFTEPIALVLQKLEGVVDTLAYGLIGLVPTCAPTARADLMKLDATLDEAANMYSDSGSASTTQSSSSSGGLFGGIF